MNFRSAPFIRLPIALLVGASIAAGCSSSDESGTSAGAAATAAELQDVTVPANGSLPSNDAGQAVADPASPNTVRVDFDITVPAYRSDALQVELAWGDNRATASWVGDEYWTANGVFPSGTPIDLVVTFHDDNGRQTLGTVQMRFTTGSNASQSIQVSAEQFDTASWDDDGDGVSNLDESVAGTAPMVADTQDLEIRETFNPYNIYIRPRALEAVERASAFFEASLPGFLPYVENYEGNSQETYGYATPGYTARTIIDLDTAGNGSYFVYDQQIEVTDNTIQTSEANRTDDDGVVTWEGTYRRSNYSAAVRDDFTFTTDTQIMDATTRRQDGTIGYVHQGYDSGSPTNVSITYSLTGSKIGGTPDCQPIAGQIRFNDTRYIDPDVIPINTTFTKSADDEFWMVTSVTEGGELMERYLLRSLSTVFHCDIIVQ